MVSPGEKNSDGPANTPNCLSEGVRVRILEAGVLRANCGDDRGKGLSSAVLWVFEWRSTIVVFLFIAKAGADVTEY